MKIYHYHPITKEFLGESLADKSPLEEDVYLIPANATTLIPVESETNKTTVFENGSWLLIDDFRNQNGCEIDEEGFFLRTHTFELGESLADNLILADVPQKFYKAKWNGEEWIEGATQEEIDEITRPVPQQPTLEDYILELEFRLSLIELGL